LASFDEWLVATAPPAFLKIIEGAQGRGKSGPYDFAAAKAWFSSKRLPANKFEEKRAATEVEQSGYARQDIVKVHNSCDELDGTNRPHAAGNPPAAHGPGTGTRPAGVTSEGALMWEAQYGQPWMTSEGHYEKVSTYTRALNDLVVWLGSYKLYVRNAQLLDEIDEAIRRAKNRVGAMQAPLNLWNNRASVYPAVWNPNGTPRTVAIISNTGTAVPDWPKNPGPV
jgi:hypothetical protein